MQKPGVDPDQVFSVGRCRWEVSFVLKALFVPCKEETIIDFRKTFDAIDDDDFDAIKDLTANGFKPDWFSYHNVDSPIYSNKTSIQYAAH